MKKGGKWREMAQKASLPEPSYSIPVPIGHHSRWRDGGCGSPNRGTTSHRRIPPENWAAKVQTIRVYLPPKVCSFGFWPISLIGKLCDGQGRMAPNFQSVVDRSDWCRLKIRDHSRTRSDVAHLLDGSNSWKNALTPSGARSWAEGRGRAKTDLNSR